MARTRRRTGCITGNADEPGVVQLWRESHRTENTIREYLHWVRRFHIYCRAFGLSEVKELTLAGVDSFARRNSGARMRGPILSRVLPPARYALFAWWYALGKLGRSVEEWSCAPSPKPLPPLIAEYVAYRRQSRGVATGTLRNDIPMAKEFLEVLRSRGRTVAGMRLRDIDYFVTRLARRRCRRTVADNCSSLRAFLRFLHATGRLDRDLAALVVSPRVRRVDRPPRALPWADVRRMLRSAHQFGPAACRDYAMLLTMATYGLGSAEIVSLRTEDINWSAALLRVRRPKTGASIMLPLLPGVARALVSYVRKERPRHLTTRTLFVSTSMPHGDLSTGAVRNIVRKRARSAGITAEILGGHVLRHSHATRQVDMGADLKIVGDILGHHRSESTSVYVRVALRRLRTVALPVP